MAWKGTKSIWRGTAGDDQLGAMVLGQPLDGIIVDQPVLSAHAVLHWVEPLARQRPLGAVGQVPAGLQRHAHDRVARLEQSHHDCAIGLCAGVGLDVDKPAPNRVFAPAMATASTTLAYSQPP